MASNHPRQNPISKNKTQLEKKNDNPSKSWDRHGCDKKNTYQMSNQAKNYTKRRCPNPQNLCSQNMLSMLIMMSGGN